MLKLKINTPHTQLSKNYWLVVLTLALTVFFWGAHPYPSSFGEQHVTSMIAAAKMDLKPGSRLGLNTISCDIINRDNHLLIETRIRDFAFDSENYKNYPVLFEHYKSSFGIQGWIAYFFAKSGIPAKYCYYLLRLIYSFLLAVTLLAVGRQLVKAYDFLFAACFIGCLCFLPKGIIDYGPNVYWLSFSWFIPMLGGLIALNYPGKRFFAYIIVFVGVFLKSLCTYEYITCVMLGSVLFLFAEYLAAPERRKIILRELFGVSIAALAGFMAAVLIHDYARSGTGLLDGLNQIYKNDVLRRTWGAEAYPSDPSLNSSVFYVLLKYLVNVPGGIIASGMLILSLTSCVDAKNKNLEIKHDVILLVLSFLTSISWFVLAKGHSWVHVFVNYILWYVAFVPAALYVFLRQRIILAFPDNGQRGKFFAGVKNLIKKILFMQ